MTAGVEWPWCARCGKPVEGVHQTEDPVNNTVEIVVRCHGETERTELTQCQLLTASRALHYARPLVVAFLPEGGSRWRSC